MDSTFRFRAALAGRLMRILGLAMIAAPLAGAAACGGKVFLDGETSGGGGAGAGPGVGGNSSASTGIPCALTTSGTSGGLISQATLCLDTKPATCPSASEAASALEQQTDFCQQLNSVDCGPVVQNGQCCYVATLEIICVEGRPYLVEGESRTARATRSAGWCADLAAPEIDGLSSREREVLAARFTRAALFEHASIASFGRFSLELLAAGAPAHLVAAAHEAALDEVRHAGLCFALASAYAGEPVGPSAFPFEGTAAIEADLAAIAVATVREGCIGETLAAIVAAEELAVAADPAVKRALAAIAEDEARHAELAYRAVAWAVGAGGEPVRRAVAAAFAEAALPAIEGDAVDPSLRPSALAAHGLLQATERRVAMARALDDIVRPLARAFAEPSSRAAIRVATA